MKLNPLHRSLLNDFQRDFPLVARPYHQIARRLQTEAEFVLGSFNELQQNGIISRIGPVFSPNKIGVSTLAAMAVPAESLEALADYISAFPQVNHNYEREHEYNLWFVINANSAEQRSALIWEIESETGIPVISLPLLRDYHIDLSFKIDFSNISFLSERKLGRNATKKNDGPAPKKDDLISALQMGLTICDKPYALIAGQTSVSESAVMEEIQRLIDRKIIKRFGVVVRHRELGYRANAMCVWDVPDNKVDALGKALAGSPYVTLCYQRPRCLPHWRYNLFCMIHGKSRDTVRHQIDGLIRRHTLKDLPQAVLFSARCFKQRGAYYRREDNATSEGARAYG